MKPAHQTSIVYKSGRLNISPPATPRPYSWRDLDTGRPPTLECFDLVIRRRVSSRRSVGAVLTISGQAHSNYPTDLSSRGSNGLCTQRLYFLTIDQTLARSRLCFYLRDTAKPKRFHSVCFRMNPFHYGIASGTELGPRWLYLPIWDDRRIGSDAEPIILRRI